MLLTKLFAGHGYFATSMLLGLLLVADAYDLSTRRIPNLVSGAVVVSGLGAQLIVHGGHGLASAVAAGLGVLMLLWTPWVKGGLGGGDVKLAAAVAVWMGLARLPAYLLGGALAGGVVALVCWAASSSAARRRIGRTLLWSLFVRAWPDANGGQRDRLSVPYALAITAGALVGLFDPKVVP